MIFVFRENSISKYGTTSLHPKAPAGRKVYRQLFWKNYLARFAGIKPV